MDIHIHAPQPEAFGLSRVSCSTCEKRSWMYWESVPWYGVHRTCIRCGEEWQDGTRSERPFAPRWRQANKQAARIRWRRMMKEASKP